MSLSRFRLIYVITALSGAAGLIYEIAWTRMLVTVFGYSTHSVVSVLSAFLAGLAIGGYVAGKWCDKKTPASQIKIYFLIEVGIGILAILTVFLIPLESSIYSNFSDGSQLTVGLLLIKLLLTSVIILPPTMLMGATLPILASILRVKFQRADRSISLLYSLNTFGALIGVIVATVFSIELFGLKTTIFIGAGLNLAAGIFMLLIPRQGLNTPLEKISAAQKFSLSNKEKLVLICFSISGFISIAYEIMWTRALTPVTGMFIHSFALILGVYLFGIAAGSIIFNKFLKNENYKNFIFGTSQLLIGLFALISVWILATYTNDILILTCLVVLPASICMGISFPAANSLLKDTLRHGRIVGLSYFFNTVGCVLGGIIANFIFIPLIGTLPSIILAAIVNFLLFTILLKAEQYEDRRIKLKYFIAPLILIIVSIIIFNLGRETLTDAKTRRWIQIAKSDGARYSYKEDDVSSVLSIAQMGDNPPRLIVNGVEITGKAIDTRLMAYLPIAIHGNAKTMLDICLGMGSTYRAALLSGLQVDAVELSPEVAKSVPHFYPDIIHLSKKGGRIIVNDGRNYVNLTHKKYDIVTIDPPPPFNSAGTTVLYSKEFYQNMKHLLNKDGIVSQWIDLPVQNEDFLMTAKSFIEVFPYAIALKSPGIEPGYFFIGSFDPIKIGIGKLDKMTKSKLMQQDFKTFSMQFNAPMMLVSIIDRDKLVEMTHDIDPVTDDHPTTEYYILRNMSQND